MDEAVTAPVHLVAGRNDALDVMTGHDDAHAARRVMRLDEAAGAMPVDVHPTHVADGSVPAMGVDPMTDRATALHSYGLDASPRAARRSVERVSGCRERSDRQQECGRKGKGSDGHESFSSAVSDRARARRSEGQAHRVCRGHQARTGVPASPTGDMARTQSESGIADSA
jgi:hypothetical protein